MKKILFVILSIFILVGSVSAESKVTSFYTIINKCFVVKDNNAVIPVTVRLDNDEMKFSKLLKEMRIGYITNYEDVLKLKVYGISNANFITSNVTDMYKMFFYCGTSCGPFDELINMSTFNTSKVTNMEQMFGCYYGRTLDVSSFDMSNVTNAKNMFEGALYLKDLYLGNFNIPENCDLGNMLSRVGNGLTNNNKTNIYVSNQTIIERLKNANTGIDYSKAEILPTPPAN